MSIETELEKEVIDAINDGRNLHAIKLLRERPNINLKQAKDIVEAINDGRDIHAVELLREHRNANLKQAKKTSDNYIKDTPDPTKATEVIHRKPVKTLVLLIVAAVASYLIYKYAL